MTTPTVQAVQLSCSAICRFRSSLVGMLSAQRSRVQRWLARDLWGQIDVVFGHVNTTQTLISHFLKFGHRVQNFLTFISVLYINFDVAWPVYIQPLFLDGLDFLVLVHLVIATIAFFVVYGFNSSSKWNISFPRHSPLGMIAAWSQWKIASGKSLSTPFYIPFGNVVGFSQNVSFLSTSVRAVEYFQSLRRAGYFRFTSRLDVRPSR